MSCNFEFLKRLFDIDQSGSISVGELRDVLKANYIRARLIIETISHSLKK